MEVTFTVTKSEDLAMLPIIDGQLIILQDTDGMFYDIQGKRHSTSSGDSSTLSGSPGSWSVESEIIADSTKDIVSGAPTYDEPT